MPRELKLPLSEEAVLSLAAGEERLLSGDVYAARDAAHEKLAELLRSGKELPFGLAGAVLYYVGPTPARPGYVIGAAGPTTARRMDPYMESFLAAGLRGTIGKGPRAPELAELHRRHRAVYFIAPAGAGAYLARRIVASELVAYPELCPEAIRRLTLRDFPVVVAIDAQGRELFRKDEG